jgi:hypothetical protein
MTSSAPFDRESPRPLSSPTANFDQGAGPSVSVPPPECMKPDHLTQEDLAKLPTFKPHKLGFLHKKKSKNDTNQTKKVYNKDVYRWAVLYENQRGYVNANF